MDASPSHQTPLPDVMPQQLARGGLRRKLLRSHLTVVALGVALLCVTLASTAVAA